jgi:glutamate transport system permease protein
MDGLPRGQREAAESIGLSSIQTTWLILLPQAIRVMLPALISQVVVILKDTALGGLFIAGYEELIAVGKQIKDALPQAVLDQEAYNPLQVFTVIGIMFIIVNYSLSKLAQFAERRLSTKSAAKPVKAAAISDLDTGRAF